MPKFVSKRDFDFFQHINKELVTEIVDVPVILFKLNMNVVGVNIYGEATEKVSYTAYELSALIEYPENVQVTVDGFGVDQIQNVDFRFVRSILENLETYPEIGDIINYNNAYYEIDNVREVELIASRPEYNQSILCSSHLTRRSAIQIEPRQI